MDVIERAYAHRAAAALTMLTEAENPTETKAAAFVEIARTMLAHNRQKDVALNVLKASRNEWVSKAVAEVLDVDGIFAGPAAQTLAEAYVASIAQFSLLDQIMKYAKTIPANLRSVIIASDSVGNTVTEGSPKPTLNLSLNLGDVTPIKSTAMIVMSNELARHTSAAGRAMFERELESAVTRALNAAVLAAFVDSGTSVVAAGANPLASLRAGLQAAGGSNGFVVAVNQSDAHYLATTVENRGMGVRGGEFAPGIHVVAVDGMSGMQVFPASRFAVWDGGMQIKSSGEATVDMRAAPAAPYELVSMFQTDSTAVLAERWWNVVGPTDGVVSVEAS